jgi:LasA protease
MVPSKLKSPAPSKLILVFTILLILVSGCMPPEMPSLQAQAQPVLVATSAPQVITQATPLPVRPRYSPGQLVDYVAQTGDTLPGLAAHFNTTEKEIRSANPVIPNDVTTLPPGFPMKIPIYYVSLWGSPYQILPDWLFINGPAQRGFDTVAYVKSQPGWLKDYQAYTETETLTGGEMVDHIATNFSVSPRLLLAIIEYQSGALSNPEKPVDGDPYPLKMHDALHQGLFTELTLAANDLNNSYYAYKEGSLKNIELKDGRLEHPDPWQNAATVALQDFFSRTLSANEYTLAISPDGFTATYTRLFGDPWKNPKPHIPGSLTQPPMQMPFSVGVAWAFTGGPHTGWGDGLPYSAVDFAPPAAVGGCTPTEEYATAVADGVIARVGDAELILDLDGDGDERTGWVVYYLHLANNSLVHLGARVKAGDPLGHPSCEGGHATGTHVHIARKYNGEWIPAGGPLAFNLTGWVVGFGDQAYDGTLTRFTRSVRACTCSDKASQVTASSLADQIPAGDNQ